MALLKAPSWGLFPETALFWKTPIPLTAPLMAYLPSGPASKFVGSASCSGPEVEGVGRGVGAAGAAAGAVAGAGAIVWSAGFWSLGVEVELSCAIPAHTSVRDMAAIASFLRYFECVTLGSPRNLIQLQNYGTLL